MKDYYVKTGKTPAYFSATVLDPRLKLQYFKKKWQPAWVRDAERQLADLYDEFNDIFRLEKDSDMSDSDTSARAPESMPFDIHSWRFGNSMNIQGKDNELKRYLNAPVLQLGSREENDLFDLIKWWKEHEKEYPVLARIAYDLFAIPCSSSEPERVFSG
jgi:hypothetical protein